MTCTPSADPLQSMGIEVVANHSLVYERPTGAGRCLRLVLSLGGESNCRAMGRTRR